VKSGASRVTGWPPSAAARWTAKSQPSLSFGPVYVGSVFVPVSQWYCDSFFGFTAQ
jgi:hypothetical protein